MTGRINRVSRRQGERAGQTLSSIYTRGWVDKPDSGTRNADGRCPVCLDGPGLPLHTVGDVTSPVAPGEDRNLPTALLGLEIVPLTGVVALVVPTLNAAVYPPSPVSGTAAR
jgi:hypothetical protein